GHAALAEECVNRAWVGGHGAAPPGAVVPLSRPAAGVPVRPGNSGTAAPTPEARGGATPQPPSPDVAPPTAHRPADQAAPPTTTSPFGAALDRVLDPQKQLEKKPTPPWVLEAGWDRLLDPQGAPDTGTAAAAK
ncbi:MAG: hypothetical protein ACXWNW_15290, partial [Isosphaeraceae bacterium]